MRYYLMRWEEGAREWRLNPRQDIFHSRQAAEEACADEPGGKFHLAQVAQSWTGMEPYTKAPKSGGA